MRPCCRTGARSSCCIRGRWRRPACARRRSNGARRWRRPGTSRAFPRPVVEGPLRGYEARGVWLDPVQGDGWIACGDAALSFDPCAAQGIFSALHGGMAAANAVSAALHGDRAPLSAYQAQCGDIRRVYRERVRAHYAQERRWPDADFWCARQAGLASSGRRPAELAGDAVESPR
jgi:flavin-dependent dehydrogenase